MVPSPSGEQTTAPRSAKLESRYPTRSCITRLNEQNAQCLLFIRNTERTKSNQRKVWEILFVVFIRAPSSNGAFTPALKSYCFKLTCLANASLPSIITVQSGEEALLKSSNSLGYVLTPKKGKWRPTDNRGNLVWACVAAHLVWRVMFIAEALGFSVQRLVVLLAPEVIGVGALGGLRLQRPLASFSSATSYSGRQVPEVEMASRAQKVRRQRSPKPNDGRTITLGWRAKKETKISWQNLPTKLSDTRGLELSATFLAAPGVQPIILFPRRFIFPPILTKEAIEPLPATKEVARSRFDWRRLPLARIEIFQFPTPSIFTGMRL
ncbi:hypothetical protein QVD17_42309 [Tagetes erecta]|uniref:Uncharacterized protein n=1 Tax=Tagetes erecta TaxID=13708 RepID=A0AAD8JLI7_TARER|nr:hypothetical protein QVD17_42296 [Tagetes erecta]KAK1405998.1 hypothetical protein QVD17_42309 [Tagetes erecta]